MAQTSSSSSRPKPLHAGVSARGSDREKLEHLVAMERFALTDSGHVRYTLKTSCRDGFMHVIFEPEDFIARLVALVPKPRDHLTRYHGVFAPASALQSWIQWRSPPGDRAFECRP